MSENTPFTIKHWAEDDRPREKLVLKGRSALSDAELIAILIATGTREESAVDIAKRILALTQNNLNELGKLTINDLKKIKGIGQAKAITIAAALELGRRRNNEEATTIEIIRSSKELFNSMQSVFADLPHEEFWVVFLNKSNRILSKSRISIGGIDATIADHRIIFKQALELLAANIALFHNHPSGNIVPSEADKKLTQRIKEAGLLMDIRLIDHIIVHQHHYFSFADESML